MSLIQYHLVIYKLSKFLLNMFQTNNYGNILRIKISIIKYVSIPKIYANRQKDYMLEVYQYFRIHFFHRFLRSATHNKTCEQKIRNIFR